MNKPISEKHSEEILTEMCKRVGIKYRNFNFDQKNSFLQHKRSEGMGFMRGNVLVDALRVTANAMAASVQSDRTVKSELL